MRQTILVLVVLLGRCPALGQPFTVGETTFSLGSDAFPDQVQCLSGIVCGNEDFLFHRFPQFGFVAPANTLKFDDLLEGAYSDQREVDNVRLDYPVPIVNQVGPDIYLGQALWSGTSELGFTDPIGINDFGILFDNGPTWHTVAKTAFAPSILPSQPVFFTDGGALEGTSFKLWFTTIDLSDFGYLPGVSITGLNVRGQNVPIGPENAGLDVAIVANLNSFAAADFDLDGDVDGADLAEWESSFGVGAGADADADGDSDGGDFLAWQRQFTENAPQAAIAVPEPAGACSFMLGAIFLFSRCISWRATALDSAPTTTVVPS